MSHAPVTEEHRKLAREVCICGHSRKEHDEEPPYACHELEYGIDCEDDDYCPCRGFMFAAPDSTGKQVER